MPAELAFCFGTGNTTRQRNLDTGMIEKGFCADFVLMDKAQHTPGKTILVSIQFGILPGIGAITSHRTATPPAWRVPTVEHQPEPSAGSGH
jgi:enamidase